MSQLTIEKKVTQVKAPPPEPRRALWKTAFEFAAFFLIGILALELFCAVGGIGDEEYQDIDPVIGWKLMPNRSFTFRVEGYSHSKINSLGMRDTERTIAKPADTYRIAVVGCSLSQGNQVAIKDTYSSVLERALNEESRKNASGRKFEVLNFSVAGYTFGQQLLRLQTFVPQFKPDLVIFTLRPNGVAFMQPNPARGLFGSFPSFKISTDGNLVADNSNYENWLKSQDGQRMSNTRWLRYHSRLWRVFGKCVGNINNFGDSLKQNFEQAKDTKIAKRMSRILPFLRKTETPAVQAQMNVSNLQLAATKEDSDREFNQLGAVTCAIVKAAKQESDKANCKFLLVNMPRTLKYREDREQSLFSNCAKNLGLKYLDFNPQFDVLEKQPGKRLYFDWHPTEVGHAEIANVLKRYLESENLLQ